MNINEENIKLATDINEKDGSLDKNFYNFITSMVNEIHEEHSEAAVEGNKKVQAEKMMDLNGTIAKVESIKETNKNMANAFVEGDMSKWVENEFTKDHNDLFNAFMNGKTEITKNKDGEVGINFKGKFHSTNDIDNKLKESKKDFESIKNIRQHVIDATNLGKEDKGLKDSAIKNSFNYKQTHSQLKEIIEKANIKSLLFDPVLDGAPFAEEVLENPDLKNIRYADLGLKPPKNDDDGMINETLTQSDAKKIVSSLAEESNHELAQELLTDYFANIVKQNNAEAAGQSLETKINAMTPAELIKKYRNKQ